MRKSAKRREGRSSVSPPERRNLRDVREISGNTLLAVYATVELPGAATKLERRQFLQYNATTRARARNISRPSAREELINFGALIIPTGLAAKPPYSKSLTGAVRARSSFSLVRP